MTTSFIDIKFYIVHCLFMVVFVEAKLNTTKSMCNVERAPITLLYNYN